VVKAGERNGRTHTFTDHGCNPHRQVVEDLCRRTWIIEGAQEKAFCKASTGLLEEAAKWRSGSKADQLEETESAVLED
jgi:hypothetical protein